MTGMEREDRFAEVATAYAALRPDYPEAFVRHLAALIEAVPAPPGAPVIDVGSGTGIFTRALSSALGPDVPVIGVEPSDRMRAEAVRATPPAGPIRWARGDAEHLPFTAGSVRCVTAATAAHWFDRAEFYAEAASVLVPSGLLAIAEYLRDVRFPAAAALQSYTRSEAGPGANARPDFPSEIRALADFRDVSEHGEDARLSLSPEGFVGLGLSSSYSRAIVAKRGIDEVTRQLREIASGLTDDAGLIPYGLRFRMHLARRR